MRSREQAVGGAEQWEDPHVQSECSKTECPVPRRQGQESCGHTRAGLTHCQEGVRLAPERGDHAG